MLSLPTTLLPVASARFDEDSTDVIGPGAGVISFEKFSLTTSNDLNLLTGGRACILVRFRMGAIQELFRLDIKVDVT